MSSAVDLYMVYQFVKRLATPFEDWEAYEKGIIDKDGNILKSKSQRRQDRKAFTKFDLLILKIKNLLQKAPGGSNKTKSYAAALWFIKEHKGREDSDILTEEKLNEYMTLAETVDMNKNFEELFEEPTMSASGGEVDSIGIGPKGEPGGYKTWMDKYKAQNRRQQKQRAIEVWSDETK